MMPAKGDREILNDNDISHRKPLESDRQPFPRDRPALRRCHRLSPDHPRLSPSPSDSRRTTREWKPALTRLNCCRIVALEYFRNHLRMAS